MARALLLALVFVPAASLAQTAVTATETSDSLDDQIINIAECKGTVQSNLTFTWKITTADTTLSRTDLRVSDTSACPAATTSIHTASLGTRAGASGTSEVVSASSIPVLLGIPCDGGALRTLYLCAFGQNAAGTDIANVTQTGTIQLDPVLPAQPAISGVTPGDGALSVSWGSASNAKRYHVTAVAQGNAADVHRALDLTGSSHRLSGLTNGLVYDVTVVGVSLGGNESTASAAVAGTPVEVNDFWRLYQKAGGREEGGCATGGAGALALAALVPLLLRRKRS